MAIVLFDMAVFMGGWAVAQLLFSGFEAHESWAKRLTKLAVLTGVLLAVRLLWARPYFYGLLGLMTTGITILHGYWFHYRHGIHWRKAEPRDKYLQLIGEKNKKDTSGD
jgi:hypothetical protein